MGLVYLYSLLPYLSFLFAFYSWTHILVMGLEQDGRRTQLVSRGCQTLALLYLMHLKGY